MEILEDVSPSPEPERPELVVLQGGLAVSETISVEPVIPHTFEQFSQTIPGELEWEGKSLEELLGIRAVLSDYIGEKSLYIQQQIQDHDAAHHQLIRINGWIRDRQ